jgi:sugar transferase (PEP-CTERM/EpsH1 system associated)
MMRKKIVHVTFDMKIGGAERVIYNLVEHTDASKYDVSVLCLNQPIGPFGIELQEKGYKVAALDRQPGLDVSLVGDVRRYFIDDGIRIAHCHQYTPYVYGLLAAKLSGCKVIFTEHGRFFPDERKIKRVLINPALSCLTDHVTAISAATREALVHFENFRRDKIKIVYNGIDGSRFIPSKDSHLKKKLGISPDAYVLGTVARLDPIKNHPMMMKALKNVKESFPDTTLLIVGDGPERRTLEALVSELGLSSRIIITGFREDTHLFYGIMDVFLLTSFSEGTAMTLLEAMAAGLPCVVTNVGGNPEIVREGETGFIIPSGDESALTSRISLLLQDEDLRKKMGQAARKRFEENFTVDKMVREYEKIYDQLTDSRKA